MSYNVRVKSLRKRGASVTFRPLPGPEVAGADSPQLSERCEDNRNP